MRPAVGCRGSTVQPMSNDFRSATVVGNTREGNKNEEKDLLRDKLAAPEKYTHTHRTEKITATTSGPSLTREQITPVFFFLTNFSFNTGSVRRFFRLLGTTRT